MAAFTQLQVLTKYFNEGDGKRSLSDWRNELAALTPEEKQELAQGVCAVMGWEIR